MDAQALNCPNCGAPAESDALRCDYCAARLQTLTCPSCFGLMFLGSKYCSHCGAKAVAPAAEQEAGPCPRCRATMTINALGGFVLDECGGCGGVWLDNASFRRICEDREKQAELLSSGLPAAAPEAHDPTARPLVYLPCPRCGELMNRVNFAGCSGLLLNVCRPHGTWFDRDDLRGAIEFIRAGGLEKSRALDLERLQDEKRRLEASIAAESAVQAELTPHPEAHAQTLAGRLLRALLDL